MTKNGRLIATAQRVLLILLLFLLPRNVFGAIALDHVSSQQLSGIGVTSLTYSETINTSSNTVILVYASGEGVPGRTISSITWNGTNLTKINSDQSAGDAYGGVWYLAAPSTGTHNVVVTFSGSVDKIHSFAVEVNGVDQTTPVETSQKDSSSSTSTPSITMSSLTDGAWVVDSLVSYNTNQSVTNSGSQTTLFVENGSAFSSSASGYTYKATAGSATSSWTLGDVKPCQELAFSLKEAGGSSDTSQLIEWN